MGAPPRAPWPPVPLSIAAPPGISPPLRAERPGFAIFALKVTVSPGERRCRQPSGVRTSASPEQSAAVGSLCQGPVAASPVPRPSGLMSASSSLVHKSGCSHRLDGPSPPQAAGEDPTLRVLATGRSPLGGEGLGLLRVLRARARGPCFRAGHRVGLCGLNWMLGTVSEPSCDPFEGSCQFSWVTTAPPQTEKGQGRAQSPRYSAPQGTREGNLLALTHRGHPWVYSYPLPLPADCFRWHKSLAVL